MSWLTVGKFALAHWQSFAIAGLLAFAWVRGEQIDNLKEQAGGYERSIKAHETAARLNSAQLDHCAQVNAANEREAKRQKEVADQAEIRARMLAAQLQSEIDRIPAEAEEFTDEECRALDEPLPAEFVNWLRDT